MNIKKKFFVVLLAVNILTALIYLNHFETMAITLKEMEDQANSFINTGVTEAGNVSEVTTAVTDSFTGLGQILTVVGAGVMVAVVSYMGIKYLISPPDKQAVLKQQLVGVLVAGIVIFGAYGIWSAVIGVVSNFD